VNLPVGFGPLKLYGQRYTQVSVSADGWIAAGNYTTSNYSNAALPSTSAPRAAFFANWDDLYPDYNNSGYVYWHHDAANHRFIVEYDSVSYYNPTSTKDKFQVIIYDTTLAATDGNSVVVVQYMTANRYSSSTAGLQDQTQAIGIQDLYNGTYAHGAASIAAGRAIKYTTDEPTGIAESPSTEARAHALLPTIVRRTLFIPPSLFTPHSSLFTAAGRRALPLRPGPNDVSCLAPGIYFLRLVEGGETRVAKTLVLH
jgi:tryptophan-rich sensory protein